MAQPKKITNEIFAKNLRVLMKNYGATQEMISEDLGIAQSAVSNYLNGRVPRADILVQLKNYFGVPIEYLLNAHEAPNGPKESESSQQSAGDAANDSEKPKRVRSNRKSLPPASGDINRIDEFFDNALKQLSIDQLVQLCDLFIDAGADAPQGVRKFFGMLLKKIYAETRSRDDPS